MFTIHISIFAVFFIFSNSATFWNMFLSRSVCCSCCIIKASSMGETTKSLLWSNSYKNECFILHLISCSNFFSIPPHTLIKNIALPHMNSLSKISNKFSPSLVRLVSLDKHRNLSHYENQFNILMATDEINFLPLDTYHLQELIFNFLTTNSISMI